MSTGKLLVVYVCLSAVYLLYLPHALPVLDDWTYLHRFSQARAGGFTAGAALIGDLISNRLLGQFRIFWAGFVPVVAVSLAAGFTAWPYYLLALISHLLAAVLLARTVTMLATDDNVGFLAGAIYVVLPAANGSLFWPVATSFYFTQALVFSAWFYVTWKKLAIRDDFRFEVKDFLFLALTAFTGEQILPALIGLLPVSFWLFGKRENRGRAMRYWIAQLAALLALLGFYILVLNRMPVRGGIENRYPGTARWSPWPVVVRLLAALGLRPSFAEWTPAWRLDLALGLLLALAGAAFWWAFLRVSRTDTNRPRPVATESGPVVASPVARLLTWSMAGAALTYLPVALLPGIEWRYLYVPAGFLSAGVAAALSFLPRPARAALAFLAVVYSISLTYFEMRQCWIPQSREAQDILSTVEAAKPLRPGEVMIFAHAPHAMGTAPAFIAGASWSMNSMLEHYAGNAQVQGARELLVNEQGDLALYRRDSLAPFNRADIGKLRVFVRAEAGGYVSKSIVALPAAGNFQLFPLRPEIECPRQPLTMDELKRLPLYSDIYFAHTVKTELPVQAGQPHA